MTEPRITEPRITEHGARADATRARLMDAAVAAFAVKGFHGTTTRDIAAAAGMSPAALYVHHRSKEELLHLISYSGHVQALEVVRAAVRGSEDPGKQLATLIGELTVHHARAHTLARIVNYELAALSDEHRAQTRAIRREIEGEVARVVGAGVASGQFRVAEPQITAVALLSLSVDVARWYREDGAWTPEQIGSHYADLALRMVGAVRACTQGSGQ